MKPTSWGLWTACVTAACVAGGCQRPGVETRPAGAGGPSVVVKPFGKTRDGQTVRQYTLTGAGGAVMEVIDYGGRVVRLLVPDRTGRLADVTLGCDTVTGYEQNPALYFGSLVGRYANRIAGGRFTLDGTAYRLSADLHGGTTGFNARVWRGEPLSEGRNVGVQLTLLSPDGDQGYPGNLQVTVRYWLTAGNVWRIEYTATTDRATPVNLTQHAYFNLKGEGECTILDHELTLFAGRMTQVRQGLLPTGQLVPVKGTPFDFTTPQLIGARITADDEQLCFGNGYDHNWVLDHQDGTLARAAVLYEKSSGRCLEVWTTEPGLQFYCSNFPAGTVSRKSGKPLCPRGALALETQHFPDSPNQPRFPSTILRPGEVYRSVTEYRFGVR
ncbi:MAG: aldose epimerase family protein [Lentisphaeria bacterium]